MLYNKEKRFCELQNVKLIILTISLCILFIFVVNNYITKSNFSTNTLNFEPDNTFSFELPSTNYTYTLLNKLETSLSQKKLIFIGDVHGTYDELLKLINKVNYDPLYDHLVFVGDLITKGPKSVEVVQLIRSLGASCVRGNNDNKILRLKSLLDFLDSQKIKLDEYIKEHDISEDIIKPEHRLLVKEFDVELYDYLLSCPIVLDIPKYNLYVVHAGLLPDVPISEQDPFDIMNMHNIMKNGKPTEEKKKGHAWSKYWNEYQKKSSSPKIVIYGHESSRGLKIKPYSYGLDSGCVHGGKLSALIWNDNKDIISVKCKKYAEQNL